MNLAVIAAFTAAGLSLVNVAVSARLSRRGSRDQWRREQAQPLVARILNLSTDAITEWRRATSLLPVDDVRTRPLGHAGEEPWSKGLACWDSMRDQAAQLDLLASHAVRHAAWDLVIAHHRVWEQLLEEIPFTERESHSISRRHETLIDATRADFAIDSAGRMTWQRLTVWAKGDHKAARRMDAKQVHPATAGGDGEELGGAAPGDGAGSPG